MKGNVMVKSAAILTIKDAANMSKKGKQDIANWLRKQAKALIKDGHLYHKKIVIRYLYSGRKAK
jgi:hypothetical protein